MSDIDESGARADKGVHTDPAALDDLTAAGSTVDEVGPDGAVAGYRASRTPTGWSYADSSGGGGPNWSSPWWCAAVHPGGRSRSVMRTRIAAPVLSSTRHGSAPNFVVVAMFISGSFLLPMIVALYFGDTVASEASWSSLKYLLAIPVPRHRLLRQKALTSALLSGLTLVLLPLVALGIGVVWYGAGEAINPTGDSVSFGRSLIALALGTGYIIIQLSWVAALGLLLSVSTDTPLGAVGGTVLVSILSQMLDQITALGELRDFLPTHFSFAWMDLIATDVDWSDMASGVLSAVLYATVFGLLAARRFATKDITS